MTTQMTPKPRTVFAAQGLFILNSAIWLIFGIAGIMRLDNGTPIPAVTLGIITILMFGNAGAMLLAGFWLEKRSRWAFGFALAVLAVNLLLTITDQVGFFDILTALVDFGLLGLIILDRKNYL